MLKEYPKRVKRALRELEGIAYERELQRELTTLDESFAEWRSGQIDGWELNDRIHKYHDGASRELWKKYNYGSADINVGIAVRDGVLKREEVPPEVMEVIKNWLDS